MTTGKNQEPRTKNQWWHRGFSVLGSRFFGLGWLREPMLWAVLLVGLVAWMLAYQVPYSHQFIFGGDLSNGRRFDDAPFLNGFNAPEPANSVWWEKWRELEPVQVYRWTTDEAAIRLPGLGAGRWLVSMRARGQPGDAPTISRWSDGTRTVDMALVPNESRVYHFLAQADSAGDLTLHFSTPPLTPPNDPRMLGFVAYRMAVAPLNAARLPSLAQLGWLACCVALCYGLARRLGTPQRWAGAGVLALVALVALLLARERLWLTIFTPTLLPLLAGCYGLAVALLQIVSKEEPRTKNQEPIKPSTGSWFLVLCSQRHRQSSIAVALIVLAFALRLGGMLHPHTIFSDIGLHANDILELTAGSVYFTEGLPSEAGGGQSPYPPGQYLVLAPGQLLLPVSDEGRKLLIKIGNALLDSMVVGMLWLMLRRAGAGQWAALLGAALYVLPIPLLKSFSVGEFANIFGQGLAMPLLALLAVGRMVEGEHRGSPLRFAGEYGGVGGRGGTAGEHRGSPLQVRWMFAGALLALALLGHLGVAISLATLLPCLAVLWLWTPATRRSFWPLVLVGIIGVAFVTLFYYSAFAQLLAERFAGTAEGMARAPQTLSLSEKLAEQSRRLNTSLLLVGLGALGALLAGHAAQSVWLRRMLGAWWLGLLLSFGLLLFANQAVRWNLFLYPALCLGGGLALAALWRRGRAARLVVFSVLAFLIGQGMLYWVTQLANYLHE